MVTAAGAELLAPLLASPPYDALNVWLPAVNVEIASVATPPVNTAEPTVVVPSRNITMPVAVDGVTVAAVRRHSDCPTPATPEPP